MKFSPDEIFIQLDAGSVVGSCRSIEYISSCLYSSANGTAKVVSFWTFMVHLCQQVELYTKMFFSVSSFRNFMMPAPEWLTFRVIALESYVPLTRIIRIEGKKCIFCHKLKVFAILFLYLYHKRNWCYATVHISMQRW